MFCDGCGNEFEEGESFCVRCGKDLSEYKKKKPDRNHQEFNEPEVDDPEGYQEKTSDFLDNEDPEIKIKNLVDIISRLQAENIELKKELEKYNDEYPPYTTSFGRKNMPKPNKEGKKDIFTRFKKWYNE